MVTRKVRPNGHIWMAAEQFSNVAEHIWNSQSVELNKCSLALVVNYALCAELSLKAAEGVVVHGPVLPGGLISAAATRSAVHGHGLDKVFSSLQTNAQQEIETAFSAATGEALLPLLAKCSDYFVNARYSYEQIGGGYDLSGIRTLALGLLQAVREYGLKTP